MQIGKYKQSISRLGKYDNMKLVTVGWREEDKYWRAGQGSENGYLTLYGSLYFILRAMSKTLYKLLEREIIWSALCAVLCCGDWTEERLNSSVRHVRTGEGPQLRCWPWRLAKLTNVQETSYWLGMGNGKTKVSTLGNLANGNTIHWNKKLRGRNRSTARQIIFLQKCCMWSDWRAETNKWLLSCGAQENSLVYRYALVSPLNKKENLP